METKPHKLQVPVSQRSDAVIEPMLTDQWFVDLTSDMQANGRPGGRKAITEPALDAVRSGEITFVPEPGWFDGSRKGTTHGTWNPQDTHIPLLFMGWGIRHGALNRTVHMTDIAPTLAAMLHIQMPDACVGQPIVEVIGAGPAKAGSR